MPVQYSVACWRAALPEGGDTVHVLAVLSRPGATPMQLQLAADTQGHIVTDTHL